MLLGLACVLANKEDVASQIKWLILAQCLNMLVASADENGKLKKVNYFVFTDGMSNGFYTFNKVTSHSGLPMKNKSSATSP